MHTETRELAVTTKSGGSTIAATKIAPATSRRVVVVEQVGGGWNIVEASIDSEGIVVLGAQSVPVVDGEVPELVRARNGSAVTLLPDLKTSICRVLDFPGAATEQIERMVALRLELELPYPVAETTWVCDPHTNGTSPTGRVLLVAAATQEIALAEQHLHAWGVRDAEVQFVPAGLAELALASGTSADTLALLRLERGEAVLVMVHAGSLCYTRQIRVQDAGGHGVIDDWVPQLAREVSQSIYDYQLRTGNGRPGCMRVVGRYAGQAGLLEILEAHLDMPAQTVHLPEAFLASTQPIAESELTSGYPACLGALLAIQRRAKGERNAAPPLQRQKRDRMGLNLQGRRGLLAGVCAVLFLLLMLLGWAVQSVRLNAAEKLISESKPLQSGLDKLQEEVDILKFEDKRQRSMLEAFLALAEALPPEVKVESLSIDPKGKVTLAGTAASVEAASDAAMRALRESKAFANPQFYGATKEKEGFGFRITCELKGGQGAR